MTILASGPVSADNINTELGLAAGSPLSLNQANVRALAGKPSGAVSFSDLWGKSASNGTPLPAYSLWAIGKDVNGIVGSGGLQYDVPTQIGTDLNWSFYSSGNDHAIGIKLDGTMWKWGYDGTWGFKPVGAGSTWRKVSCDHDNGGDRFFGAVRSDGTLWMWGTNSKGQLGTGDTTTRADPTQISYATDWQDIVCCREFTLALKTDGSLYSWGLNAEGQLGQGDTTNRLVPTKVGTGVWKVVAGADSFAMGVQTNGSMFGWGSNSYGQQGFYGTGPTVPTQVGTNLWHTVACGYQMMISVRQEGTLWAAGWNQLGQLGAGTVFSTDLVQIGTDTDWRSVASGYFACAAIKRDGSLWTSGYGAMGQLGIGPGAASTNVFVRSGSGINWARVSLNNWMTLGTMLPEWSAPNTITVGGPSGNCGWMGLHYPYGNIGSATVVPWKERNIEVVAVFDANNSNYLAVTLLGNTQHLDVDLMVDGVTLQYENGASYSPVWYPAGGITMYYLKKPTGSLPFFVPGASYTVKVRLYQGH